MASAIWPGEGSSGGSGVDSLNSLTGVLTIAAGTGITVTASGGNTLTIAAPDTAAITALTGDVTATGPGSAVASLVAISNSTLTTLSALSLPTSQLTGLSSAVALLTAANISATSNSTLTTLSALSLPYSQLTGTPSLSGYVTSVSVASTNGFAGTSSGGQTPALTLSTTITGILKGNGTAISAATAGTDYVIPSVTTLSSLSLPTSQLSGNISLTAQVSGILPVNNGGTGVGSLSANQVIIAGTTSTSAFAVVAGGTSGYVLTSTGTTSAPTWQAAGTPTFSGLTTDGVMYAASSTSIASTAAGTTGQVLTATTSSVPTWTTPTLPNPVVQSFTTTGNHSITSAMDIILCSNAVMTVVLPDATVAANQKYYTIKKTDASLANIITFNTVSSQTISSGTSSYASGTEMCFTEGETWVVFSDGSNWQVETHTCNTDPVAYTPTITGGSLTANNMYSFRRGAYLCIKGAFNGYSAAASAASMTIGFNGTSAPSGLAIVNLGGANTTIGLWAGSLAQGASGNMLYNQTTTIVGFGNPMYLGGGTVMTQETNATEVWTSAGSGAATTVTVTLEIQIAGWLN